MLFGYGLAIQIDFLLWCFSGFDPVTGNNFGDDDDGGAAADDDDDDDDVVVVDDDDD